MKYLSQRFLVTLTVLRISFEIFFCKQNFVFVIFYILINAFYSVFRSEREREGEIKRGGRLKGEKKCRKTSERERDGERENWLSVNLTKKLLTTTATKDRNKTKTILFV